MVSEVEHRALKVKIVRYVDDCQPGIVECEFQDAQGRSHKVIDKVPIFTDELLSAQSTYPAPGAIACEILDQWRDTRGRDLVRISIARPWGDESTEGLSEFIVVASQLMSWKMA